MPKARETCTRCSMRRQRCDKQQPCSRCVEAGEAHMCTRTWAGGYNPEIHRQYPKSKDNERRLQKATWNGCNRPDESSRRASRQASLTGSIAGSLSGSEQNPQNDQSIDLMMPGTGGAYFPDGLVTNDTANPGFEDFYSQREFPRRRRNGRSNGIRQQKLLYLQHLFPTHGQILQLVEYHEAHLLWLQNCIHGPTFRQEVVTELQDGQDRIRLDQVDLRWAALVFAVLSATMACAPEIQMRKWRFAHAQRHALSKDWYAAAIECLMLGEFSARPHPCSVQTIQILGTSSHYLGLSNKQFVMHGTALRIAQSLGLQRLPHEPSGDDSELASPVLISRETGRRIWWTLVLSDWFSIPSYDSFCIHPAHWTTARPQPYATDERVAASQGNEALADYTNYSIDVARVMVDFHISTVACSDPASRYDQVLKHDARLRQLIEQPFQTWDTAAPWLPWAARSIRILLAQKILMVHRYFLGRSFRDAAYAFTRWASIEAAKIIIREVDYTFEDPERPNLWCDQAHLIGAGITLCLDTMHRPATSPEFQEHRRLVDKALMLLDMCDDSVLALRGYRLLSAMLREGIKESFVVTQYDNIDNLIKNNAELRIAWCEGSHNDSNAERGENQIVQLPTPKELWEEPFNEQPSTQGIGQQDIFAVTTAVIDPPVPACSTMSPQYENAGNVDEIFGDTSWTNMLSEFFVAEQLNCGDGFSFDEGDLGPQLA